MDFQRHLRHFAVEQIESYLAINGGDLLELSPQQLTSCSPNELQCGGTGGCAGSIASLAFTFFLAVTTAAFQTYLAVLIFRVLCDISVQ